MLGRQPYSTSHTARDSAIMAFLTFGEGYHNYHHEFQHDYRNGVKPWQWDPSKWTIWTLSKLGLVDGLRRVPDGRITMIFSERKDNPDLEVVPLFTHPPQQRQPLTTAMEAEIEGDCLVAWNASIYGHSAHDTVHPMFLSAFIRGYRAAERAHGIGEAP